MSADIGRARASVARLHAEPVPHVGGVVRTHSTYQNVYGQRAGQGAAR